MSTNSVLPKFDGQFRRLEFVDEKSSKFWEVRLQGASVEVRYGKIGTPGQSQLKEFADKAAAHKHAEKMMSEKLKGGYVSLSKVPQEAGESRQQVTNKSSTIDMVNKLKLNKKQVLAGEFPKDLDLGDLQLDFEIFVHGPEVFSMAAKKGLAPQANLTIANNSAIETLRIGCDDLGMTYVLIENCANLKSIEVYLKSPRSNVGEPKWLICKDLPKLESFVAAGSLLSLQIEAAPSLKTVRVGQCAKLGVLSLIGSSVLRELDINGCKKLPWVQGLTEEQEAQLYVESKVDSNCTNQDVPSFPFKDLNFRQVDKVLEVINKGMMTDFERGRPNQYDDDLSIQQYSINLLRPLEQTNAGGTGEQYAYELVTENGSDPDQLVGSTRGEHSPEDCLNSALRSATEFIIIDGVDDQSESIVFDYLKRYGREKAIAPEVHNAVAFPSDGVNEKLKPTGPVDSEALVKRTLCISGKLPSGLRKADYESALANIQIKLLDDVVKGLTFLVLAEPASTSAKAEKARKLGVQVISEDQLIALTSGKWNGL